MREGYRVWGLCRECIIRPVTDLTNVNVEARMDESGKCVFLV